MRELLVVVVPWLTMTSLASLVLMLDERRLRGEARARSFPRASRLSASFGLALMSPLQLVSIPVHFWRTRRSFVALLAGLGLAMLVLALGVVGAACVLEAPELPFPRDPRDELVASTLVELALFAVGWAILARVSRPPRGG
jgi:hypothetical protein